MYLRSASYAHLIKSPTATCSSRALLRKKYIWQKQKTFASGLCTNHTILKLMLQVIVYAVWRERNGRIFSASSTPLSAVKRAVDRTIRDRLLSFPASDSRRSFLEVYFSCISSPI
uniref:Uncharacterized protein n=1 Tax=Noccaea caerulescens TaxID=107243 RepID=A0A1J3DFP6_NOCCA